MATFRQRWPNTLSVWSNTEVRRAINNLPNRSQWRCWWNVYWPRASKAVSANDSSCWYSTCDIAKPNNNWVNSINVLKHIFKYLHSFDSVSKFRVEQSQWSPLESEMYCEWHTRNCSLRIYTHCRIIIGSVQMQSYKWISLFIRFHNFRNVDRPMWGPQYETLTPSVSQNHILLVPAELTKLVVGSGSSNTSDENFHQNLMICCYRLMVNFWFDNGLVWFRKWSFASCSFSFAWSSLFLDGFWCEGRFSIKLNVIWLNTYDDVKFKTSFTIVFFFINISNIEDLKMVEI